MLDDPVIKADALPDLSRYHRITLEPGTAYRFRLSAINGCGLGEYGEVWFYIMFLFLIHKNIYIWYIWYSARRSKHVCPAIRVPRRPSRSPNHPKAPIYPGNHRHPRRAKSWSTPSIWPSNPIHQRTSNSHRPSSPSCESTAVRTTNAACSICHWWPPTSTTLQSRQSSFGLPRATIKAMDRPRKSDGCKVCSTMCGGISNHIFFFFYYPV